MTCPECGCQACPNCLGALCDCGALDYAHDEHDCMVIEIEEEAR